MDAPGQPYDFTAAGDQRIYADLASATGLHWVAGYADGVGLEKLRVRALLRPRAGRRLRRPAGLAVAARAGL